MVQGAFWTDGRTFLLTLRGHADYAPSGQDIVCAACSILAYAAAETALQMYREGFLAQEPSVRLEAGDVRIWCKPARAYRRMARDRLEGLTAGFALLALKYPEHVHFRKKNG